VGDDVGTVLVKAQEVLGSHAGTHIVSSLSLLFVRWTSQLDESVVACFFPPSSARPHLKWAFGYI